MTPKDMEKRNALIIIDINNVGEISFESIKGIEKNCAIIGKWTWYETNIKRGTYTKISKMHNLSVDRIRQLYQKHLRRTIFRIKSKGAEYGEDFFYEPDIEIK